MGYKMQRPFTSKCDATHLLKRDHNAALAEAGCLKDAALAYAGTGWPVFPLTPRDKLPLIPEAQGGRGVHDATTEAATIEAWWRRWPKANIGLAAGPTFWALDIDYEGWEATEPDGADTFAAIEARFGKLPATVKQQTGSGGWQLLFKPHPGIKNLRKCLPGIDTRSAGGYIVAPPSVHPCGKRYRWLVAPGEVELATAPAWLIALVEPVEVPEPARPKPVEPVNLDRYAAIALERACERIARAPVGEQCDALEHQAFGLGRLVGGGVLPLDVARAALIDAGLRMRSGAGRSKSGKVYRPWTHKEITKRVERALAAGERKPRRPEARP